MDGLAIVPALREVFSIASWLAWIPSRVLRDIIRISAEKFGNPTHDVRLCRVVLFRWYRGKNY